MMKKAVKLRGGQGRAGQGNGLLSALMIDFRNNKNYDVMVVMLTE